MSFDRESVAAFDVNFDCYSPYPCRASQRKDGRDIIWVKSNASKSSK